MRFITFFSFFLSILWIEYFIKPITISFNLLWRVGILFQIPVWARQSIRRSFFQSTIWKRARSFFLVQSHSVSVLFVCLLICCLCVWNGMASIAKWSANLLEFKPSQVNAHFHRGCAQRTQKTHISRTYPSMKYGPALFQRYGTNNAAGADIQYQCSIYSNFGYEYHVRHKTLTISRPVRRN